MNALLVVFTLLAWPAQAERRLVEAIVVRVNERILTVSDLKKRAVERSAETGKPLTADEVPAFLQEAVDELCLLERAAELKIEVDKDDVEAAVAQLKEQNRVADDEAFNQLLANLGLTRSQLEARLRTTITINRTLQKEVGQLPITEEELRTRYEEEKESFAIPEKVHLEHLLFPIKADGSNAAQQWERARALVAAVRAGGDFGQLLQEETKKGEANGGDLGEIAVPDLRDEVARAVAHLKAGEVSEPFAIPAGVHVIRVKARIPKGYKPFSQVVEQLRLQEMDRRYRQRLRAVVDNLKKRYVVELHPEYFRL
ncbi:MAG: peptidyl-prolyl cis-trans isomerase [Thermoanaerobaculum sp.]|nr:peptidyl-prolyl cis-trans isomerase [Thermoanaerobaculum sp.]MDW7967066.1 peptidyl-prolyl cis-trans isomerase [Thermoanaerobaculum sp.]